jgi:hypothetical protein
MHEPIGHVFAEASDELESLLKKEAVKGAET